MLEVIDVQDLELTLYCFFVHDDRHEYYGGTNEYNKTERFYRSLHCIPYSVSEVPAILIINHLCLSQYIVLFLSAFKVDFFPAI